MLLADANSYVVCAIWQTAGTDHSIWKTENMEMRNRYLGEFDVAE